MGEWWKSVSRGPAAGALLVSLVVVTVAVRWGPERRPAHPGVYRTFETALPAASVVNVPIGVLQSASAHHLRITGEVKAHLHRRHDETVVVLSGRGRIRLAADTMDVGPGAVIRIPRGTVHALEILEGPLEAVSVFSPPFDGTDRVWVDD